MDKENGFRAPVAAVTWAFVSEEVDQRLQEQAGPLRRLRPHRRNCGAIGWLIDAAGEAAGVRTAMQRLASGPFKDRPLKMTVRGASGAPHVTTLEALLAERANNRSVTPCR